MTSRGHSNHSQAMPANEHLTPLLLMLSKSALNINVHGLVNLVIDEASFTQVGAVTPQVEGSTFLHHSIGMQLRYQRGKPAFSLSRCIGPYERHVHEGRGHFSSHTRFPPECFYLLKQSIKPVFRSSRLPRITDDYPAGIFESESKSVFGT